jgi:hypothetical protein
MLPGVVGGVTLMVWTLAGVEGADTIPAKSKAWTVYVYVVDSVSP